MNLDKNNKGVLVYRLGLIIYWLVLIWFLNSRFRDGIKDKMILIRPIIIISTIQISMDFILK